MSIATSITPIGRGRVMNLTVHKNHTFVTGNGIVTHNCDGSTPDFQAGLKGFLEAFSANCRFIFTANIKHKIIEPIRSRCTNVDFSYDTKEKAKIASSFFRRVVEILNHENIEFDQKVVAKLVERNFPDFRKTLNELQRHSQNGKIDSDVLNDHSGDNLKELVGFLKKTDFTEIRKWVARNEDLDPATIFRGIYDIALTQMKPQTIPNLVLVIADYGYKAAFCADQQVNTTACMVEIMTECEWL
ncbi:MAG: AAA family ATPase [Desulfuromonadaceae bacterium]